MNTYELSHQQLAIVSAMQLELGSEEPPRTSALDVTFPSMPDRVALPRQIGIGLTRRGHAETRISRYGAGVRMAGSPTHRYDRLFGGAHAVQGAVATACAKEVPVSPRHGPQSSRRRFLGGFALAGAAGLLGVRPGSAAAEPSPETTSLRLARTSSICQAPQYIAEVLLEAEGFTKLEFVGEATAADSTLVSGDAQIGMLFLGPFLQHLDEGAPLLILAGGHVGCLELFAHEPIRSVRDLRG
jgi:hypothetical protein